MHERTVGRERGITITGLLILVAFVGLFVYAGIRLTPIYIEYMAVAKAVSSLKADADGGPKAMQIALEKRFDIDDVKSISWKDVQITKEGSGYSVHVAYDAETPFVGNIGFVVHFDNTVLVGGATGP
jgi:hypothetical protein